VPEVSTNNDCGDAHSWRPYTDEEMTALRSQTRSGRPSGAWVEGAEQCEKCGKVEAKVSWWGQLHRVAYAPREPGGAAVIHWPNRQQPSSGGGTGMGQ
jgi:hypothetical protein